MDGLRYLLDTNILSALIRQPQGPVAAMLARRGYGTVCTSIVVAAELCFGARKLGSSVLTRKVDELLASLPVLPLEAGVDETYAQSRLQLERAGTPIGPNDLPIAAHALDLGLTLVTDNVDEFTRVSRLRVENWLDDLTPVRDSR
ncbi:type II toxin-antitoxin system VapC family toxin [Candidatus Thiodictyon syntrophicum]|jgi:tRNA(fMet)-specific endonuclease VapC|uniref:Ribonuclease VapC n=1 Tax=Candidatus Thiodictyon syntrophicum TaxID=1166950 RepID=A0A2K8UC33_9GAMM|nr:type II toxin-antitoxin system VapC family toxin [Candidatus Thiodictyon syntrophicum]AUB83154.1 VapC toxin family PIN domain ribonuclease [Candidatus Thiodictyon syntrophicum]